MLGSVALGSGRLSVLQDVVALDVTSRPGSVVVDSVAIAPSKPSANTDPEVADALPRIKSGPGPRPSLAEGSSCGANAGRGRRCDVVNVDAGTGESEGNRASLSSVNCSLTGSL